MSIHLMYLINSIKNAYFYNKTTIIIDCNVKLYPILKILYFENIILSYVIKLVTIVITIVSSSYLGKKLKLISSRFNLQHLKYITISKFISDINSFIIFSTNKGYVNNINIKKYKIGGVLLLLG